MIDKTKTAAYLKAIEIERHRKQDQEAHNAAINMLYSSYNMLASCCPMYPHGLMFRVDRASVLAKYEKDKAAHEKRLSESREDIHRRLRELNEEFKRTHTAEGYRKEDVAGLPGFEDDG